MTVKGHWVTLQTEILRLDHSPGYAALRCRCAALGNLSSHVPVLEFAFEKFLNLIGLTHVVVDAFLCSVEGGGRSNGLSEQLKLEMYLH